MFDSLRPMQPGATVRSILFYRFVARCACTAGRIFWGLRAIDIHKVPATGPLVLAANHQSYFDPPFIGGQIMTRNLDYIARAGLFKVPLLGPWIRALNSIPVSGAGGKDAASIREVIGRLNQGRATLIFPEGSRTEDGTLQPFAAGVLLLVRKTKCPVVPVAITGAYKAWPRRNALPTPWKSRVTVQYGDPISAETLLAMSSDEAMALIRERIEAMLRGLGDEGVCQPKAA